MKKDYSWESMTTTRRACMAVELVARSLIVVFVLLPLFLYFVTVDFRPIIALLVFFLTIQVWLPLSLMNWRAWVWSFIGILVNFLLLALAIYYFDVQV